MARREPHRVLLGLGLAIEAVYLVAVARLPWWTNTGTLQSWSALLGGGWGSFAACLAGTGVVSGAYLWGWTLVRRGAGSRRLVWGFAILFAVTLLWLLPITSDLFTYLTHAHLFTDLGANPLSTAPLDFVQDRVSLAYPTHYSGYPSAYGPAWLLLSAVGTAGVYDVAGGLFYLKALALVSFLGCAWLVERILQQRAGSQAYPSTWPSALEGLYFLAWNPLVLFMAVGEGHNDMVMMALVLLALWFVLKERWVLAAVVLVLSVWIKYVSLVFVPLVGVYAWQRLGRASRKVRWATTLGGILAAAGVSGLVFAPFGESLSLTKAVVRLVRPVSGQGWDGDASSWALVLGLLAFGVVYAVLVWRLAREHVSFERLVSAAFEVSFLALVFGAVRSQPWHLIWPSTLAGFSIRRWALPAIAALSVLLLVVQFWVEWGAPGW